MFAKLEVKKLGRAACVAELAKLHVHLPVKLPNDNSEVFAQSPSTRLQSRQLLEPQFFLHKPNSSSTNPILPPQRVPQEFGALLLSDSRSRGRIWALVPVLGTDGVRGCARRVPSERSGVWTGRLGGGALTMRTALAWCNESHPTPPK
eukprot:CAMPEP_0206234114 /NCGR_PEP_ID=MMETSP0047_2-20121206/12404_1 /ASSEMBLY_ACC=CAM_ASM_000192 /TAXON_ID=195065 /ORGANISM="Chroomonas mesostigmatica_cf, Strain CCMP1168" /LENGTH=147 /DNA_ID=CAMNT_0053658151 /DNA_START=21 /DNA_END=462 /DNA_ORIENTATION=+